MLSLPLGIATRTGAPFAPCGTHPKVTSLKEEAMKTIVAILFVLTLSIPFGI